MLHRLFRKLRSTVKGEVLERELEEELLFHLEMKERALVAQGLSPAEARRVARRELGNLAALKFEGREAWRFAALDQVGRDLRFAGRALRRSPGFTAAAILSATLGIGATTAIFSVMYAVLLKPLPYPEPEQLVILGERTTAGQEIPVSYPNFVDWRAQMRSFENLSVFRSENLNLTGGGEPERLSAMAVSAGFFSTLRIEPALGRTMAAAEEAPSATPVALLGHGLWQRRFGGSRDVVGQTIRLNQRAFTVIGVMPAEFRLVEAADVYVPITLFETWLGARGKDAGVVGLGRLADGVSIDEARAELLTVHGRLQKEYPDALADRHATIAPLQERLVRNVRPMLLLLFGAVGLVLLISCANVATLLLERATARRKEMAVRAAIGASRGRLIQQMVTESLLLFLIGGALGLVLATWSLELMVGLIPGGVPASGPIGIDRHVLGFALVISLVTGIIFGLVPAMEAARPDLNALLGEGGRGSTAARPRARALLVATEFAMTAMLLLGGGLLTRSFVRLQDVDPGFDAERLLAMQISLPTDPDRGPELIAFFDELRRRVEALPGVESIAISNGLPFRGSNNVPFEIEGRAFTSTPPLAALFTTTPSYHRTLGIATIEGRSFSPADRRGSPRVTLVDDVMARQMFPGESPVGKRIRLPLPGYQDESFEIVGVVDHVENRDLGGVPQPQLYFNLDQVSLDRLPRMVRRLNVVVRASADPGALAQPVRAQVTALRSDQPVFNLQPMSALVDETIAPRRFSIALFGVLAAIALITAVIGIYGLVAYSVLQRRREVAIRMALGAEVRHVLRLIVGGGMKVALIGLVAGLMGGVALTRLLASMLFEVSGADPPTIAAVALVLAATALAACYLPARRAAAIPPMTALRNE